MIATEYAFKHPDQKVIVIDMCPQANISEILLGGNGIGTEKIAKILAEPQRKTIGGYFDARLSNPDTKTGTEAEYIIEVCKENPNIPNNLFLICGDPSLELQVQSINQLASVDLPDTRWKSVHSWVVDLKDAIGRIKFNQEAVFFLDCNPSFSTYTAQALVAADKIIVPCTADGSSARALDNILQLVYGVGVPLLYQGATFNRKINDNKMSVPEIHLIINNRSTIHSNKPAKAFKAMFDIIDAKISAMKSTHPNIFTPNLPVSEDVPDAHTVAIVCSNLSLPLRNVLSKTYPLTNGQDTMVNKEPLERYKTALDKVIAKI